MSISESGAAPTRWAGVPVDRRRQTRADLLVDAAFRLLASEGPEAVTVRAASRSAGLNARYFYESFATPDELLLALFKREFGHLAIRLAPAFLAHAQGDETALRQAIEIVLTHLQEDPARANVLFTDGIGGASLRLERHQTLAELGALMSIESRSSGGVTDPVVAEVLASLFSGSMAVLAQRWCSGELGDDPGRVADVAATLVIGMVTKAAAYQPTS